MEDGALDGNNNIRVVVRIRPFNARELTEADGEGDDGPLECSDTTIVVRPAPNREKTFSYDQVLGPAEAQDLAFEAVGVRLVENALNAYNGCIFAYGQTGAGKSHSVIGDVRSEAGHGILPRACTHLFNLIAAKQAAAPETQASVLASYLEIYNERLFDLLGKESFKGELQVRSHPALGAIVPGLTECPVQRFADALELLDFGQKRRAVGATNMNATSSRSHAVFTMQVRLSAKQGRNTVESESKLHFVDLAGSERLKKTESEGSRLKEGASINASLTVLGRVISELAKPASNTRPPFRDSKLTLLLKDALMGNSRTDMLACISPAALNVEETLGTLEFASRCKLVKTSARKNQQSKTDVVTRLTNEKADLEDQLKQQKAASEELVKQLQESLEAVREEAALAQTTLQEKQEIEKRLQQLDEQEGSGGAGRAPKKSTVKVTRMSHLPVPADKGLEAGRAGYRPRRPPPVGARVVVDESVTGSGRQLGTVKFVGACAFAPGFLWVGVALDNPLGMHAGVVEGKRYFDCEPEHGVFARPDDVKPHREVQVLDEDRPGDYRIINRTTLTVEKSIKSHRLSDLRPGMFVKVLEVLNVADEQRVRGRIKDPEPGWFSILNTEDNHRWSLREMAPDSQETQDRRATMNQLHMRLSIIEKQEPRLQAKTWKEQELESRLERERKTQEARKQELELQIQALEGVQESLTLDQAQMEQRRRQQHEQREEELSKLGMHLADVQLGDITFAPKLVNLHPDPALMGCLVFCLPVGETRLGSDGGRCRVKLTGPTVAAEVCVVVNEDNRLLELRPLGESLVRLNGRLVGTAGCALTDGDRLAIGHSHIFQAQIPAATPAGGTQARTVEEDDFQTAMEEISASTEVDPEWENGIRKAMNLVRSDFGADAARHFLQQSRRASEACAMANTCLSQMPERWRGGVRRYELSVLFDAHGLPEACVVARPLSGPSVAGQGQANGLFRSKSGASSRGIWSVDHFWMDRLRGMYEAVSDIGLERSLLINKEPGPENWESRIWCEISTDDYKDLASDNIRLRDSLRETRARIKQLEAQVGPKEDGGVLSSAAQAIGDPLRAGVKWWMGSDKSAADQARRPAATSEASPSQGSAASADSPGGGASPLGEPRKQRRAALAAVLGKR